MSGRFIRENVPFIRAALLFFLSERLIKKKKMIMQKVLVSLVLLSGCFTGTLKAQWVVVKPPAPRVIVTAPRPRIAVAVPAPRLVIVPRPVVVAHTVVVRRRVVIR